MSVKLTFEEFWGESLERGWIRLGPKSVEAIGVDYGGKITILAAAKWGPGTVLTLHIKGGTHWSGRGSRGTHGASVMTILVTPDARNAAKGDRYLYRYVRLGRADLLRNDEDRQSKTDAIIGQLAAMRGEE